MGKKRKKKRKYLKRSGWKNKHHNKAKSKGGSDDDYNIINMDENRHAAYHLLFKNKTFTEAAALLKRVSAMKRRQYA